MLISTTTGLHGDLGPDHPRGPTARRGFSEYLFDAVILSGKESPVLPGSGCQDILDQTYRPIVTRDREGACLSG